jgi:hypothetical protein|tara:strand:- start:7070 stop:7261 length:192 start_codon:yes stop_codon:yes gene_type:complete
MHAIKKLNADIKSSRRRMQAGLSPNAEKSAQQTGETVRRKQKGEHSNTAQPRYIDSGTIILRP